MIIKHDEMVKVLAKSGDVIASELTGNDAHITHMAIGISGEAAELLECIDNSLSDVNGIDRENALEELGDLEFFLEGIRQGVHVTREETIHVAVAAEPVFNPEYRVPYLVHNAIKVTIKAGRLLDAIKRKSIYRKPLDLFNVLTELHNIELYLENIRHHLGFTREETLAANIAKLGKRYEGLVYSDKSAQDRADKVS